MKRNAIHAQNTEFSGDFAAIAAIAAMQKDKNVLQNLPRLGGLVAMRLLSCFAQYKGFLRA